MADFREHFVSAGLFSGVFSSLLGLFGATTFGETLVCFAAGCLGGLLPDVDSDTSVFTRVGFNVFSIVFAFLVVFVYAGSYSLVELALLWTAAFLVFKYLGFLVFTKLTSHRGVFHSVPMGVVFAFMATSITHHVFAASPKLSWLAGLSVFLGCCFHLLADEFSSLNLLGTQVRRSLGSAFKLYDPRYRFASFLVYVAAVGLFFITPETSSLTEVVDVFVASEIKLWPENVWFGSLSSLP